MVSPASPGTCAAGVSGPRERTTLAITIRNLRYLVAVGENESVSGAAQVLGVSQSTVTEAIKALEAEAGQPLFERRPRGMVPTEAGWRFLRHAERILAAVAEARRSFREPPRSPSGVLELGVTSMVSGYFLADLLARHRRAFPAVETRVREDERPYIEHLLIGGELDAALLLVSQLEERQAFEWEILDRSPLTLWLPASHPLLGRETIQLADIAREPLIVLTTDELERTVQACWAAAGLRANIVMRTASVEAVRSLVATGAGVSVLPLMAFRRWSLEGDRLEVREIADPLPTIDVGLVWRRGTSVNPRVHEFLALARAHRVGRGR